VTVIDAGDTALVLSRALLSAKLKAAPDLSMEKRSTYVFKKEAGKWRCVIDSFDVGPLEGKPGL
jgi:ketosteroid isomerase-like protein